MPNSLKCKIKHLCYNGTITERERDRILKALEQEQVLNKIREEIEWQEEWLMRAGNLAFSAIKSVLAESEPKRLIDADEEIK